MSECKQMQRVWGDIDREIGMASSERAQSKWFQSYAATATTTSLERTWCEHCNSLLWISEEGYYVCSKPECGHFYTDVLYQGPEWRFYGAEDAGGVDPTRCGMPINPLLQESALGCRVLSSGGSSLELSKIRQCTEWQSAPYREKAQYNEFQRIIVAAQNAGISKKIVDDALYYYKRISSYKQHFRGDNKGGLLLGSVFLSCRANGCPRTAGELAETFRYHVSVATHGCKNAQNIINELDSDKSEKAEVFKKMVPADFIERYCSKLQMSQEFIHLCKFISVKIENQQLLPTNAPSSVAAGIVYFVSSLFDLGIDKQDIKVVSEISPVTINKCSKLMCKMTAELIPASLLQKYNIRVIHG